MTIERRLNPEEEELLAKQAELEALADQLAQKELALQTIRAEIDTFFRAYNAALISVASTAEDVDHRLERVVKRRLRPFGVVFDTYGIGRHITVRTDGFQRLLGENLGVLFEVELSLPGVLGS